MGPVLTARGLIKRYGRVTALDNCDFDLLPGEVLGVIGDNGAGKSTLIKAVSGAVIPDEGVIEFEGAEVNFRSPIEARAAGIETVYQTLARSPALSIADNMFMGTGTPESRAAGQTVPAIGPKEDGDRCPRKALGTWPHDDPETSIKLSKRFRAASAKALP